MTSVLKHVYNTNTYRQHTLYRGDKFICMHTYGNNEIHYESYARVIIIKVIQGVSQ